MRLLLKSRQVTHVFAMYCYFCSITTTAVKEQHYSSSVCHCMVPGTFHTSGNTLFEVAVNILSLASDPASYCRLKPMTRASK